MNTDYLDSVFGKTTRGRWIPTGVVGQIEVISDASSPYTPIFHSYCETDPGGPDGRPSSAESCANAEFVAYVHGCYRELRDAPRKSLLDMLHRLGGDINIDANESAIMDAIFDLVKHLEDRAAFTALDRAGRSAVRKEAKP